MSLHGFIAFAAAHAAAFQSYMFLVILATLWLVEHAVLGGSIRAKLGHSWVNLLFMLSALPIQLALILVCIRLASWTTSHHWGLVYLLPYATNPLIKYGLMFFVLDLLDYVYHSTMHRVPAFWRFHKFHHTDRLVDVSTTVREHPGETFVRNCFLMVWVFLFGASVGVLFLRQSAESVTNILQHTRFRLSPPWARVLGWLFITPNLHHTHHHHRLPHTNSNFGDVFSLWDRLFGTLSQLSIEATVFGVESLGQEPGRLRWPTLRDLWPGQRLLPRPAEIYSVSP
jgi:sterol desaturase/sphingolipid hydroxylase (fatty acid hydroxylase superfamily)